MIFKEAINENIITQSPFLGIKYSIEQVNPTFLIEEEVLAIWNKKIDIKRIEQVRDIFVFCCLTGLAFVDCYNLSTNQIQQNAKGEWFIRRKRQKTKIEAIIPLGSIAIKILEKYDFQLPILSNQKMNAYLKEIQEICGISKLLTFHVSRHTAAVMLLNRGVSLHVVSKILGHSNVVMTQHYAKLLENTIINEVKSVRLLEVD